MADKVTRLAKHRAQLDDWRAALAFAPGSGFLGDERNVLIAMRSAPELLRLTRFNEFALNVEFTRSPPWRCADPGTTWSDSDDTQCAAWLQAQGLKVRGSAAVNACIEVAAKDASFHPVRDYLASLTWDGTPRLAGWLQTYLNATGPAEYLSAVGLRFLISAVARIMQPGCQADHMLVLEGPQGDGKTSIARALAAQPAWFAGNLPEITTKDALIQLCGHWIIEIAELKAIRTSQIEAVKNFLTQCIDTFRPPYGRRTGQFPRQCVFIGTTNERTYLRDRTGNRRYWPVKCGALDVLGIARDRDALWAEAVHLYRAGTQWHLTDQETKLARIEQQDRVPISEIEEQVRVYVTEKLPPAQHDVTVREVLVHGLDIELDGRFSETAKRLGPSVAEALEACGWTRLRRVGQLKRTTYRRVDMGGQEK